MTDADNMKLQPLADRQWALHREAKWGTAESVKALLDAGLDANTVGTAGLTPLHAAAMSNNSETVRTLLDHGADASLRERGGRSAEDLARANGHAVLAEVLRDAAEARVSKKR